MAICPVLREAEKVLRPGFDEAIRSGQIPSGAEFRLSSTPVDDDGLRRYEGAALLFTLGSSKKTRSRAWKFLHRVFERAKREGQIPQEALFKIGETSERGTVLRWPVAVVPSWGQYFGRPTICD